MKRSLAKEQNLTQARLHELLHYDSETGVFVWLQRSGSDRASKIFNSNYSGKRAGVLSKRGYRYIRIRQLGFYSESRIAWLYMTGSWPHEEIDHINGNPSDNRFENLRAASRSENGANRGRHKNNKSGFKGVCQKRKRWVANIRLNNKNYPLGSFASPEEAHAAYQKKAVEIHREFARL